MEVDHHTIGVPANKILARSEESSNMANGIKLLALAGELLLGKPKDEGGAKELAKMARERLVKASKLAEARGANFGAAMALYNSAGAVSILSENFEEELEVFEDVVAKLKEAVPEVTSGAIEAGAFENIAKEVNSHLFVHIIRAEGRARNRIIGLMLACNDLLRLVVEQGDGYVDMAGLIGMRGILRAILQRDGTEEELTRINADAVNEFKKLADILDGRGSVEAEFAKFLRKEIIPDFNRNFKALRSGSFTGDGILELVRRASKTDPNDPTNGIPIYK